MWEFLLQADYITNDSGNLVISDISDWSLAADTRDKFGLFVLGEYRLSATPSDVTFAVYAPLIDDSWTATTPANGRYSITGYAFYERDYVVPADEDVQIHTDGLLYQWDLGLTTWNLISLEDAVAAGKAFYTSTVLEVPFLSYAYTYKNKINLDYIKQVKNDIQGGADQNKLYYKRTDLDYFSAMITGTEYNWSIALYSNYYEGVINLNDIINSGQIS